MQPVTALPPLFIWMQRINTAIVEVRLCNVGKLMNRSIQMHDCNMTSMRKMRDINSVIMVFPITDLGNLLEVRHNIWSIMFVRALWVISSSLTGIPQAHGSLIFLPFLPFDFISIKMLRKRGKSKREPTYYNFTT